MNCVIVIPVFNEILNHYEELSLKQCKKILGKYPIRIIAPRELPISWYYKLFDGADDFGHIYFPSKYFKSPQTYNRFMKSIRLYKALESYDYFLMHHTDAFVFSDELESWVEKGFDNIGAPLYEYDGSIAPTNYLGVGNGGFSLRNISSSLKVLSAWKKVYTFTDLRKWYAAYNWKGKIRYSIYFFCMVMGLGGWSHHLMNYSRVNEDIFWGMQVPSLFPWFKVAPFDVAIKFSMEYNCDRLLQLNGYKLPFGCHQWYKGDFLKFWKPHIVKQGHIF